MVAGSKSICVPRARWVVPAVGERLGDLKTEHVGALELTDGPLRDSLHDGRCRTRVEDL